MRYIFLVFIITLQSVSAQVGINTTNPDNSSILEINSGNKGVLFPRLSTINKNNITSPATGLMVYDTTQNCLSVNVGDPTAPKWRCQDFSASNTLPINIISNTPFIVTKSQPEYQRWNDLPGLTATFTLNESRIIRFDWTLFVGQNGSITSDGYAQSFTILNFGGTRDSQSSNYIPMIHSVGGQTYDYAMNNSSFTYTKLLAPGTYTVKVQTYVADFRGGSNSISFGANFTGWQGASGMTNNEKRNAASNKLIVTYL